ncbi:MAG: tRNA preQ1(34) S-adenosylmethionine ribosyltransferase-isomerase QueA [Candidatus Helarchaeota archaeon]
MSKLNDFDFSLPEKYIAQTPLEQRETSKLLLLKRGEIKHKIFKEIVNEFENGDILVLNNSKVMASRFSGRKETGGRVNLLFIREIKPFKWQCLIEGKKLRPKLKIIVENGLFDIQIIRQIREGIFLTQIHSKHAMNELIEKYGTIPLPNYIKNIDKNFNFEKYQTVFAKKTGSIAAPTAGFHFTKDLLSKLVKKGVKLEYITLHVGVGLILRIHVEDPKDYHMEPEFFEISKEVADSINNSRESGNKIIAVGTTTLKALESSSNKNGKVLKSSGFSELFIYPGYKFKFKPDGFITNFHLPKSPPLLMVAAYAGTRNLLNAYQIAIKENYRFYSFGDAMYITS